MKKLTKVFAAFILVAIGLLCISNLKTNALTFTQSGFAFFISTQFGEDAATETRIHWNSEQTNTYAMFAESNDEGDFSSATREDPICTQIIFPDEKLSADKLAGWPDVFYECELTVSNLKPATRYMYYVTDGVNKSDIYRFTTAPNDSSSFAFGYVNDPQIYGAVSESNNNWTRWLQVCDNFVNGGIKDGTPINFIIGGGDMINNGGDANQWSILFNNHYMQEMQYFSTCGNHEYTPAANSYETFGSRFYGAMYNNPKNGYPEATYPDVTCYWKYGDTLFVSIASCENKNEQVPWLDSVLANNPAQWIIVIVHMNPQSTNSGATARQFVPTFDKYGVDLVLFGDEHVWKTYDNYYNFKQVPASQSGTYYLEQVATSTYYNYTEGTVAVSTKVAVSENAIVITSYDMNGGVVATKALSPRRPSSSQKEEFDEETFVKQLEVSVNQDNRKNATLIWPENAYGNVKTIALKSGDNTLIDAVVSSTKFHSLSTSSLTADIDYDAYIEYTLMDGTVKTVDYDFTTKLSIFGTIENLTLEDSNKGYLARFKMTLRSEVDSLKVYINDVEYANGLAMDARKLTIPYDYLTESYNEIKVVTVVGSDEYVFFKFAYEKEIVKYNINYDLDGGVCDTLVTEYTEGETVTLPTPTKDGYNFLGWYEGETKVEAITEGNHNLVAKWEEEVVVVEHECEHVCPECGKCLDPDCDDPACADKCPGHEQEPVDPTPVDPTPVDPTPVDPTPVDPEPQPKSGCGAAMIINYITVFLSLGAILFIRKRH